MSAQLPIKQVSGVLLIAGLVGLAGCSSEKNDKKQVLSEAKTTSAQTTSSKENSTSASQATDTSKVLISIDGKPALTENQFDSFVQQAAAADKHVEMALQYDPHRTKCELFDSKKRGVIISAYVKNKNIRQSDAYTKRAKEVFEYINEMLDNEAFLEQHKVDVSDDALKDFYEKNKETHMKMSPAGVDSVGVKFETKAAADAFAEKVRNAKDMDIDTVAQENSVKIDKLGVVNADSLHVEKAVRDQIDALKKFPAVAVVDVDDKTFWVIKAKDRQAAEYVPFDQIKENIRQRLLPEKVKEMLDTKLPEYEKTFNVTVNQTYLDELCKKREELESQLADQLKALQDDVKKLDSEKKTA